MNQPRYIRFDWAIKRLLRNKSNFVILEGFLSELLGEKIRIDHILESESNQDAFDDKFNRVDMLATNSRGELVIIEVQNSRELSYFHRMLYGTSKVISEYIHKGDPYENVRKVYSINIVYFELGQGLDYIYHGRTTFKGTHNDDILLLSTRQQEHFIRKEAGDLFPEYYVLRVNEFDAYAVTPLDEWIEFLKTGDIAADATAAGLPEARERMRIDSMADKDRRAYEAHLEALSFQKSVIDTGIDEGRAEGLAEGRAEGLEQGKAEGLAEGKAEGLEQGLKQGRIEIARKMKGNHLPVEMIVEMTGLNTEEIENI